MARAAAAAGQHESEEDEKEDSTAEAEKPTDEEKERAVGSEKPADENERTPPAEVRRAMDAVLGEVLAAASSPAAATEDTHSVSSEEPAATGGSSGDVSGDERSAQPTPEVRRAMNSVLSQMTAAATARDEKPAPADAPRAGDDGPRVGGHDKPNQVAAPPEPSMKEQLDLIIKQAVQKAAKRVSEAPEAEGATAAPESPPAVDNIGDGMHRVRSRKHRPGPTFDMNELMSRFEKKDT